MHNNYKVIKGSHIAGRDLSLPRAKSIYKAAVLHNHIEVIECRRQHFGVEILLLRFNGIDVPDEPEYDIHISEDVAICCTKEDLSTPEVYVLRKDFPLGLPHSNARPFEHPVSLCVSDIPLAELRLQWNAYVFLNSIFRWFNLNCVGRLHEKDRPLEVFFQYQRFCYLKSHDDLQKVFGQYDSLDKYHSSLKFVEKKEANCLIERIAVEKTISTAFACLPKTIEALNCIQIKADVKISDLMLAFIVKYANKKYNYEPLFILYIPLSRSKDLKEERFDVAIVRLNKQMRTIAHYRKYLSKEHFRKWYMGHPVQVDFLIPPVDNETNARQNGIGGKSIGESVFIGYGTLGANIVDKILREGTCSKITIVDNDVYNPHNYSRHILPESYIGKNKAYSFRHFYANVEGLKLRAINKDYFSLTGKERKDVFSTASLIIDASTSIPVERSLCFNSFTQDKKKCTVFLNPKGTDLVILFDNKKGNSRLDMLEMDYYKVLLDNEYLKGHLEAGDKRNVNSFSCRSTSNVMSYDNIGTLSGIGSQQIKKCTDNDLELCAIWTVNQEDGTVRRVDAKLLSWRHAESNGVEIYYTDELVQEISNYRQMADDEETGGCLYGCYDRDRNIIYVFHQHIAPTDSEHGKAYFIRGCKGLETVNKEIAERTFNQVGYLGEWHSHPHSKFTPSTVDDKQFEIMYNEQKYEDLPFVQIITGTDGVFIRANI